MRLLYHLLRIDLWVLFKIEDFANWAQRMTGLTSQDWARGMFALGVGTMVWDTIGMKSRAAKWCMGFMILVWIIWRRRVLKRPRKNELMNELKITEAPTRLWLGWQVIFVGIVLVVARTSDAYFLWLAVNELHFYFSACDDLPWAKSRLKQWLDGFGKVRQAQTVTSKQ